MTQNIYYTVEWTINDGQLDAFKKLADDCVGRVHDKELEMLDYQWYFNADNTVAYLRERHTSSESMLFHIENIGDLLGELLQVSKITRFEIFGNTSDQARRTFEEVGKQTGFTPVFLPHYSGFAR